MGISDLKTSSEALQSDLGKSDNLGALSGGPKTDLPEQAIEHEDHARKDVAGKMEFAAHTHQYIREYITAADQKAAFYLAAFGAVIAYSNSIGILDGWVSNPTSWTLTEIIELIHTLGLLIAIVCCLWVVMPRLKGSRKGIIFFNSIAEYESYNDFITEYSNSSMAKLLSEKLKHTYDISQICRVKYTILGVGLWSGGIGTIFWPLCYFSVQNPDK